MKAKLTFLVIIISFSSFAQLRLPSLVSSGMVLQQNDSVSIWGWGDPGKKVLITTSWDNKNYSANINNRANWKTKIKTKRIRN